MSESQVNTAAVAETPAKKVTVYEKITMTDGRVVEFAGTRQTDKTVLLDEAGVAVGIRFDFRNGQTRSLLLSELAGALVAYSACHGIAQKAGDDYAGVKEIDDIVLSVDEIFARLRSGEWGAAKGASDSTAGASIVIKAICEVTGKDVEAVKAFLQGKLDKAKAAGEKLSRQELYNSFRNPASKTGVVIDRLEKEKLAKTSKADAGAMLEELGG